jgi:DNA-binding MarR family transcriptional regulator
LRWQDDHAAPISKLETNRRGFSCHRLIQILALLEQSPQSRSLSQISASCLANIKPVCEHVRRLHLAGLVARRRSGRMTMHHLTPFGQKIIAFFANAALRITWRRKGY